MYSYNVLVETNDTEVTVTVQTEADLNNCDEDIFRSDIQHHLEQMGFDEIDHFEVVN